MFLFVYYEAIMHPDVGLKFVFCFMQATPSHFRHYADLLNCIEHIRWRILEACVNVCWVYAVGSVSMM